MLRMHTHNLTRLALLLGLGLLLTGCQSATKTHHAQAMDAANTRWMSARTALLLQMAQRQFDTGDLEQAEKSLNEAFNHDPKNPRLFLLGGRIALERGQLERGFRQLELASELDATLAEPPYFRGVILQRWRQFDAALEAYATAYRNEPDNAAYLMAQAEMLVSLGRHAEARQLLEPKVAYFDQNAAVRAALAHVYELEGNSAQAADYLRQAVLLQPDDLMLCEELAAMLQRSGQTADAVQQLEKLCAEPSLAQRSDLMHQLADGYLALGQLDAARAVLLQLRRRNDKDVQAWIRLGQLAWAEQDLGSTLTAAARAMALAPQRHEGYLLAALVWQTRGNREEALRLADRAAQFAGGNSEPLIVRGILLQQSGQPQAAAKAYAQALERDPGNTRVQSLLAQVSVGQ